MFDQIRPHGLDVALFYYAYKNKQEQTVVGADQVTINTGPVRIYGVDAASNIKFGEQWSLRAGATWLPEAKYLDFPNAQGYSIVHDGLTGAFLPGSGLIAAACPPGAPLGCIATGTNIFDASGYRLPRAPKLSANATISFRQPTANGLFDASTMIVYASRVAHDLTQTVVQKANATLAAQAGYKFARSGLRVGVYGQNLTNRAKIVASLVSSAAFLQTISPPREVGVVLNYSY